MRHLPRFAFALLVALAASCGVNSLDENDRFDAPPRQENERGQVIVDLELPTSVQIGEAIPMILRAKNAGQDTIQLGLTGNPIAFNFIVTGPDGADVWSRLHGKHVPMILQIGIIAPGEALEFTHHWDQRDNAGRPVGPGIYRVRGVLPTEEQRLSSETQTLTISQ